MRPIIFTNFTIENRQHLWDKQYYNDRPYWDINWSIVVAEKDMEFSFQEIGLRMKWLRENCGGRFHTLDTGEHFAVAFEDDTDATVYRLRF